MRVLKTIGRLFRNYKPDLFFNLFAVVLEGFALLLFMPVLIKFWQTQTVPNFPTLIVAGFVALAGILSFFTGLILLSGVEKDKRDFEMQLLEAERNFDQLTICDKSN